MAKQFRKLDQLMMSLGDKEATYDAGPALWTYPAAYQLFEFGEAFVAWEDRIETDRETVHGSQHATLSEIIYQDARFTYGEPRIRPSHLGGLAALALGNLSASVQDAALAAYRHKILPVGATVVLPGIGIQEKASGEQYKYSGVRADSIRIYRNGAYWAVEVALIGSGTRATAADAFVAKLTGENPLRWQDTFCWLETGTDISIDAAPTQGLENISSGTPDALKSRLVDAEFRWGNDLQAEDGYAPGGSAVRTRLDHGPGRIGNVRLDLIVDEATLAAERAYYTGQVNTCVEIENKGATVIAAGGAMYPGFDLIIPRTKLRPIGRGVRDGYNVITFEGELFDDGVNETAILYVYSAQATYLA